MISLRSLIQAILLLLVTVLIGCDNSTGPSGYNLPLGRYERREQTVGGGRDELRVRTIVLESQRQGRIFDSLFVNHGAGYELDSVAVADLRFQPAGDGYLRTLEIHTHGSATDSTYRYWYFFKRDDSLFYYVGDRLLGTDAALIGRWQGDVRDSALTGERYSMEFTADSVTIAGRTSDTGLINGVFRYTTEGRMLIIQSPPSSIAMRYEVVPGLALYLTSTATGGFAPVR